MRPSVVRSAARWRSSRPDICIGSAGLPGTTLGQKTTPLARADVSDIDSNKRAHRRRHERALAFELGLALIIIATGALTLLAIVTPYFTVDLTVERAIQSPSAPWLETLATAVSWFGFPPQSNVVFGLIILVFAVNRRWWDAAGTALAAAGSAGVWFLVAPLVHRPRPTADLVRVAVDIPYGSFPSGHVLNFTATFGFLAFLAWRGQHRALTALCLLPPLAIALSRVYLGEHWPSDVLGGFLFGALWLALTVRIYRWARQVRQGKRRQSPQS
jgi:membrane-associated phospholipid phosphatase